jgi:Uma2 family endonuclease
MTIAENSAKNVGQRPRQPADPTADETISRLPPLETGDRLTRDEFERRYQAMPEAKKAELIEGVVYMPSPVRHRNHSKPHALIVGWLAAYYAATPGVDLGDNATVRLDTDNEVQPDAFLRLESARGGQSMISADDYVEGAPELIAEIAASSASYDLHDKLQVYRRNGVREYLIWQVYNKRFDWYRLEGGTYVPLPAEGTVHSHVFPGLHLAVPALLNDDLATVLAELQRGLQTPQHADFVRKLAQSAPN